MIFALTECEKTSGSSLWIYVFLGNMLRGIGETPVMPLGMSYMDDFAKEENTAVYIGMKKKPFEQGTKSNIYVHAILLYSRHYYTYHNVMWNIGYHNMLHIGK